MIERQHGELGRRHRFLCRLSFYVRLGLLVITAVLSLSGCASPTPLPTRAPDTATSPPPTVTPLPPTATIPAPTATIPAPTSTYTITPSPLPSDTLTPSETPTSTSLPPTPSGEDAIYVYYIQLKTGGPVACGDSLVAANTGLARTGDVEADVRKALERLFFKRQWFGKLYNPVYLSNISVGSVKFDSDSGLVSVYLKGTYVRSGDRCDNGRVHAQIWTTIRQFEGIKTVYVLLNENLLGDILATE